MGSDHVMISVDSLIQGRFSIYV